MNTNELEKLIAKCLHDFYDRRTKRIQELKLKDFMSKKNPYLFRAIGTEKASEIVEDVLRAFISSSDEGMFGDAFFEPIAKLASGGVVAPSEGVDVAVETGNRYMAIAVKSGPNWGNAGQLRKQNQDFIALQSRLYKLHKQFDAVIGHGYGRKKGKPKGKVYRNISGQAFWTEITGDPDFYLKLIRLMKDELEYKKAWDSAVNRFTGEFIEDFCFPDGQIDWEKLVQFVSEDKTLDNPSQAKLN